MYGTYAHMKMYIVCWGVSPCMVWSLQHLHPGYRPWRARPPMCIRFARLPFTCSLAWIRSWRRRISDWEERLFRNWQVCGVAQSLLPATFFADISHKYCIVLWIIDTIMPNGVLTTVWQVACLCARRPESLIVLRFCREQIKVAPKILAPAGLMLVRWTRKAAWKTAAGRVCRRWWPIRANSFWLWRPQLEIQHRMDK